MGRVFASWFHEGYRLIWMKNQDTLCMMLTESVISKACFFITGTISILRPNGEARTQNLCPLYQVKPAPQQERGVGARQEFSPSMTDSGTTETQMLSHLYGFFFLFLEITSS